MDKNRAKRILAEFERRHINKPKWLTVNFDKQNDFINHPAKMKALQCSRRSGKSYACGIYAYKEAYENPGCSVVILGLTRDSVKRIFLKDILRAIDKKNNLKSDYNLSELSATLPNGSVIYLLGIDSRPELMDKLLGQKNKLVIIDEGAFYRIDMKKLVYEILKPTMIDNDGTLAIVSTTSNITNSLYFDIVNYKQPGWEVFKWTAADNPFLAEKWAKEIKELIKNIPTIEETPMFRRMYLNEWTIDEKGLVYKYKAEKNNIAILPNDKHWRYVLGVDLGYEDASSFVTVAYSEFDPRLYIVDAFSQSGMIVTEVADKIKELTKTYRYETMVIDGASKQAVEEMKKRHHLPLIIAEKTGKRDMIEMLNSDLLTGNIVVTIKGQAIVQEWKTLVWDEIALTKGKHIEHSSCDNHLSDAFLYAWRHVLNYCSKPKTVIIPRGSEAQVDKFWEDQSFEVDIKNKQRLRYDEDAFS